jgi:hypothetical protein
MSDIVSTNMPYLSFRMRSRQCGLTCSASEQFTVNTSQAWDSAMGFASLLCIVFKMKQVDTIEYAKDSQATLPAQGLPAYSAQTKQKQLQNHFCIAAASPSSPGRIPSPCTAAARPVSVPPLPPCSHSTAHPVTGQAIQQTLLSHARGAHRAFQA